MIRTRNLYKIGFWRYSVVPAFLILLLSFALGSKSVSGALTCPTVSMTQQFTFTYGVVTINNAPAPVGSVVVARNLRGNTVGCEVISRTGEYGLMYVYGEETVAGVTLPGMRLGEIVAFTVNGVPILSGAPLAWNNDRSSHQIDLTATSSTTPTTTPMSTSTPITTPTTTPMSTSTPTTTPTTTSTSTPIPGNTRLYLESAVSSRVVSQIFTVNLSVDTGTATADTVDAYLNFDPAYLEVVDAAGNPATSIDPNTALLGSPTFNTADNASGQINFSASRYASPYINGSFTAATIRFRAKAAVVNTNLTFAHTGARQSDLLSSGDSLNPTVVDSAMTIASSVTLNGRVALEHRGVSGDLRWITPLERKDGTATTGGITVYQAGTSTVLGQFAATTDASGHFSVELTGLQAGVYDISVKGGNTLSTKRANLALPSASEIDFGTLLAGDSTGNDAINGGDVSYMIPSFLKDSTDPVFRPYADTNNNGVINGADVSALIPNFLRVGPIAIMDSSASGGQKQSITPNDISPTNSPRLFLNSPNSSVSAGEIVTLNIIADTAANTVDTIDAYINFDSSHLEVVDATGAPVSAIERNVAVFDSTTYNVVDNSSYNVVDNSSGQINFSASSYNTPYLSGMFTVATIHLKVKAGGKIAPLVLVRRGARISDMLYAGESINPITTNSEVTIISDEKLYLPIMRS